MKDKLIDKEAQIKLEHYCSYQDRCHQEVTQKLYELGIQSNEADTIIVHLIENNFLNEERFARSFARGKHRIKGWGNIRIVNELKQRQIATPNIKCALTEISEEEYQETFDKLASRHWDTLQESNQLKKKKKFCDYLLRKGWESDLIYEKWRALSIE
ncbi:regulatory protein RecX [Flavobacterium sp. N1994]|uniref:regulatory protein RecX n=1 Tax=Flavobacterium sp. N1994 TaxID=2986827 RepID=UPI002221AF70|nr:regulatory protein RecX [Flavobacterium sp. N1994]